MLSAASDLTLWVVSPAGAVSYTLPAEGKVRIGRAVDNDVCVDEPTVSRYHAILHLGAELALEDLGGSNGTSVARTQAAAEVGETSNLRPLRGETVALRSDDRIVIGSVQLLLRPALSATSATSPGPVVKDAKMLALFADAERVARAPISVLLLGETGVGKEVLSRYLHERSLRSSGPLVPVNCAALSETLLEAELFGHERGAFTGAHQARPGLIEAAHGGTVFLDEVAELSPTTQAKLLRVLEGGKVLRVGAHAPRPVDVRFIAATNRELDPSQPSASFRQDLYFRLAGAVLTIPPLRQRPSDVEALARLFLEQACEQLGRPPLELPDETLAALLAHDWPGNVRELKNAIWRASALAPGSVLRLEFLPSFRARLPAPLPAPAPALEPLPARSENAVLAPSDQRLKIERELEELERVRIQDALDRCAGNQTRAAEELGISRRTLVNRLRQFQLPRPRKPS